MKTSLKMADRGLSTIMESQDKDSTGKRLSSENRRNVLSPQNMG